MTLQLLGGMPARKFLARHWQRRPLLVRQAIPGFRGIVPVPELLRLASRDDVESRLVMRRRGRWILRSGPVSPRELGKLATPWTILVQGVDLHDPRANALIERFAFLPRARLDDLMISYATAGAGVGPHLDSYDVFLLQGEGRRRWRIGTPRDRSLVPGAPLRILENFTADQEWVLEPGDLLYLPPGVAHDGVALEPCTTYSIGFRAPLERELAAAILALLEESLADRRFARRYTDPGAAPAAHPGKIPAGMLRFARGVARKLRPRDAQACRALGLHLSEPKPDVVFDPPRRPLAPAAFAGRARAAGLELDRRTRLLYAGADFFINGEPVPAGALGGGRARNLLRRLADTRHLERVPAVNAALLQALHDWYVYGWVHCRRPNGQH